MIKFRTLYLLLTVCCAAVLTTNKALAQCIGYRPHVIDFSNTICDGPSPLRTNFSTYTNPFGEELMIVYDYTLPTGLTGKINISATGAQGGYSFISCIGYQGGVGGKGMGISGTVMVGRGAGMIPPGSVIRYVLGEHGEKSDDVYEGDQYVRGGSGGGSSAILFRAPDSTSWHVLIIAGAGGGGSSKCYPVDDINLGFLIADSEDGGDAGLPYKIYYKDSIANGHRVIPLKSVVPSYDYFLLDSGLQGGGAQESGRGAGGGGFNESGHQASGCADPCTAGQNGLGWISYDPDFTGPEVYKSNGTSCIGIQERSGGRGFTGGGAGISRGSVVGSGGGGGHTGGKGGGGAGETVEGTSGGTSFVDSVYVRDITAQLNPASGIYTGDDGFGIFEFVPNGPELVSQPQLELFNTQLPPICAGTLVTLVARLTYANGSPVDSFSNAGPNVYTWYRNGSLLAFGEHFQDSTVTVAYTPGDSISCVFWGYDDNACGKTAYPEAYYVFRQGDESEAGANVVLTADPDSNICYRRVYDQFGGYNIEAWATFRVSAEPVLQEFPNGDITFYADPNASAQEMALRACEAEYGVGNCSIGTHPFWCTSRPAYSTADSIVSGNHALNSQLNYPEATLVTGQNLCGGFTYYYKTGTSQDSPFTGTHQFVFDATAEMNNVNQDFSNVIIAPGPITYMVTQYNDVYPDTLETVPVTIYNTDADTVLQHNLFGENLADKFPFKRTFQVDQQWTLTQRNLGAVPVFGSGEFEPAYTWYRNGVLQGTHGVFVDGNGVEHPYTIPFTEDTLWIRNIAEGDVFTARASSNHCADSVTSNAVTMHVSEPSYGGEISGPEHPCVNSLVTYQVSGETGAVDYEWSIDGVFTEFSPTGNTCTFRVDSTDLLLACMPKGECGLGDTAYFTISPARRITEPCYVSQVVVTSGDTVRCEGSADPVTLSVYDPSDCYQWNTGETTQSITVTEDGSYFAYVNGCRTNAVTLSPIIAQHPTVSIAINPAAPGEEGLPWCKGNITKSMGSTVTNYTGSPNIDYRWYVNGQYYDNQNGGLYLNLNFFTSYDTVQLGVTLDEECAIEVFSNKVILPQIFPGGAASVSVAYSQPYGCPGDTVTFTAIPVNGGLAPTYTWRVDGDFASETSGVFKTVFPNNSDSPESYEIQCVMFGSELACRTGSGTRLTLFNYLVYPMVIPAVSISAEITAVCPGNSITFVAHPVNQGSEPTYQWFKNGIAAGTNDPVFTDDEPADGDSIYCVLTNTDVANCMPPPVQSAALFEKVYTPLSPQTTADPASICIDESTDISATLNALPGDYIKEGFAGIYAPGNWSQSVACPHGSINTVVAPASVAITATHIPQDPDVTDCNNDFIRVMPEDGTVSFDWDYHITADQTYDAPYLVIDNVPVEFPEITYDTPQPGDTSGHYSIAVTQGQTLTLRLRGKTYVAPAQSESTTVTFSNFKVETEEGIKWYDAPEGGTLIGSTLPGEDLTVTPLTTGTAYYYAEASGTDAGCGTRSAVAITVDACNEPPVAVCQDVTVTAGANCNAVVAATAVDEGSYDPDEDALTYTLNPAGPFSVGTTPVTLTVSDPLGETSTCSATITVTDISDPVITCPANITINCQDSQLPANTGSATATDNCGVQAITSSDVITPGNCSGNYSIARTWTATDVNGNTSSCIQTITVQDITAPVITCLFDTLVNCTSSVDPGVIGGLAASDNCGSPAVSLSDVITHGNCNYNYIITRTWTAEDACGNSSSCIQTISVQDTTPPVVVCPADTVVNCNTSITPGYTGNLIATDECGSPAITLSDVITPGSCDYNYTVTRTWTATDACGNATSCIQVITIQDTVAPVIVCPADTVVDCNTSITPGYTGNLTATDNCSSVAVTLSDVITPGSCDYNYTVTRTWTATEICGKSSTCIQIITVQDTAAPVITCAADVVLSTDIGQCYSTATLTPPAVTDNCGNTTITNNAPATLSVGTTAVTWTATDVCGNASTCVQSVTVEDNEDPTAICRNLTVYLDASGNASIAEDSVDNGSADACGIVSYDTDVTTFTCADAGANTVELTITDVNGNTSTCTSIVTVEDNTAPEVICHDILVQLDATGNASITGADIDGGSSDICGIASVSIDVTDFNCDDIGTNPVTLTVTDNNGNTNTCNAFVTVVDILAPDVICNNITMGLDATGIASITANDVDGGSYDACGIASLSVSPNTFDCSDIGDNTVTLTVTDNNGNTNTCTATITIEDNTAPAAVCQDITVQLDANGIATITGSDVDGGSSDACGIASVIVDVTLFNCGDIGTNPVTLIVTDINGNTSTCAPVVTVEDNIDPNAVCQNITVQLDANGTASITADDVNAGSNDACGIASLAIDQTSFDCDDLGSNTVTLTVTDNNGNISTCTATVTVEDNIAPVVTTPGDIVICAVGTSGTTVDYDDIIFTDNCGATVTQVAGLASGVNFPVGVTTNTFEVEDAGGNMVSVSFTVTIYSKPVADFTFTDACDRVDIEFTNASTIGVGTIDSYAWGFDDQGTSADEDPTHLYAEDGAYDVTLTVTSDEGCVSSVTHEINVLPLPTFTAQVSTVSCNGLQNGSIVVVVNNGSGPFYQSLNGGTEQLLNTFSGLAAGTYTVNVRTGNNCSTSQTVTVTQPAALSLALGSATAVNCADENYGELIPEVTGGTQPYRYYVDGGTMNYTSGIITDLAGGDHIVTVRDANNCELSMLMTVPVLVGLPFAGFTYNIDGLEIEFTNTTVGGVSYLWSFGDGPSSTDENPTHMYPPNGNYDVRLVAYNECGSDTIIMNLGFLLGIDNADDGSYSFNVYPNPNNGSFTMILESSNYMDKLDIRILTVEGKLIEDMNVAAGGKMYTRNFSYQLASGMYILEVSDGAKVQHKRFVVR